MFSKFHDYGVLRVLKGVSRVFQGYFKDISRVFFGGVSRSVQGFPREFQGCLMVVSRVFRVFQW